MKITNLWTVIFAKFLWAPFSNPIIDIRLKFNARTSFLDIN